MRCYGRTRPEAWPVGGDGSSSELPDREFSCFKADSIYSDIASSHACSCFGKKSVSLGICQQPCELPDSLLSFVSLAATLLRRAKTTKDPRLPLASFSGRPISSTARPSFPRLSSRRRRRAGAGEHCFDYRPRTADVNQACMDGAPLSLKLLSLSWACRVIHEIPAPVRSGRRAPSHRLLLSRSTSRRAAASSTFEANTDSLSYHPAANLMDRQNRSSACEPAPSRDCRVSVCQHH